MANRSITVTLRANVQDFKSQFDAATKAAENAAKGVDGAAKQADTAMGRMVQSARDNREAWSTAGTTLTGFGAAALGGLGLATKAAMDWESAWAGVQKTVDGSVAQMAALEEGLRGMARELPASHQEIAAVAEAAGQLGIATPNILGFTRTMIDLGESTNLSAEQAATSLSRFMNIMGTSQGEVGRLGASVVGLGNNFATTESEIVDLSMRLAGASAQANLTEGDVLGIATAMSSVGIEAEAGGTAMSLTMKRIGKEVETGGDKLELFAQVAGMSAEEFATAWRERPAEALDAFVNGLARTEQMGMSTNAVLSELGITGIRESDALLRLSSATGVLSDAMAMGNAEFDRGTALIAEAAKRYETAESQIAMARNALVDLGISVGGAVLPVLANLASSAGDVVGWFADLPRPVHEAAAGLTAVVGAGSLAAGSFLLLFPRVMDTVSAFKTLNTSTSGMAGKIGKIGLAVGAAAAAMPLLISGANAARDALLDIDRAALDIGMEEMAARTLQAADATSVYDSILGDLAASGALNTQQFDNLGTAVAKVADMDAIGKLGHRLGFASGGMDLLVDRLKATGDALALLYQTDLPAAQKSFQAIWAEAEAGGASFDQMLEVMPAFKNELQAMANAMGVDATDSAVLYKIATGELTPVVDKATGAVTGLTEGMDGSADATKNATGAVEEQVDALAELQNLLQGTANLLLGARGSELDFLDSVDAATEALKEHGRVLDENGNLLNEHDENARKSRRALDDIAASTHAWADAQEEAGASAEELDGIMSRGRESFIKMARDMGMSEEAANSLADQLQLLPDFVETEVRVETEGALGKVSVARDILLGAFDEKTYTATVDADTDGATEKVWGFGEVIEQETADQTATVTADVEPAIWEVNRFNAEVDAAGGTVTINGDTLPADQALATIMEIINSSDGTVTIDGMTVPADQALGQIIGRINSSDGTVTIDGNNAPALASTDEAKKKADGTTGTVKVKADASKANREIDHAARDRTATITVKQNIQAARDVFLAGFSRAHGGPVFGPGTETSDSIPARLSHNEHVLTAREVRLAGGHDAIFRLRSAIRAGELRFASGGTPARTSPPTPAPVTPPWARGLAAHGESQRAQMQLVQNITGADPRESAELSLALFRHELRAQSAPLP